MSARGRWRLVILGIALVLLGGSCLPVKGVGEPVGNPGDPRPTSGTADARVGALAPTFELEDLQGDEVRLEDLSGQVVLINFWATWCGYCRAEFPLLQEYYERHQKDGFVVLAVNIQENRDRVVDFAEEMGLTLPVLLDSWGRVAASYRVRGLPTSYLVDRDGIILEKHIGPVNESILDEYLVQSGVR